MASSPSSTSSTGLLGGGSLQDLLDSFHQSQKISRDGLPVSPQIPANFPGLFGYDQGNSRTTTGAPFDPTGGRHTNQALNLLGNWGGAPTRGRIRQPDEDAGGGRGGGGEPIGIPNGGGGTPPGIIDPFAGFNPPPGAPGVGLIPGLGNFLPGRNSDYTDPRFNPGVDASGNLTEPTDFGTMTYEDPFVTSLVTGGGGGFVSPDNPLGGGDFNWNTGMVNGPDGSVSAPNMPAPSNVERPTDNWTPEDYLSALNAGITDPQGYAQTFNPENGGYPSSNFENFMADSGGGLLSNSGLNYTQDINGAVAAAMIPLLGDVNNLTSLYDPNTSRWAGGTPSFTYGTTPSLNPYFGSPHRGK